MARLSWCGSCNLCAADPGDGEMLKLVQHMDAEDNALFGLATHLEEEGAAVEAAPLRGREGPTEKGATWRGPRDQSVDVGCTTRSGRRTTRRGRDGSTSSSRSPARKARFRGSVTMKAPPVGGASSSAPREAARDTPGREEYDKEGPAPSKSAKMKKKSPLKAAPTPRLRGSARALMVSTAAIRGFKGPLGSAAGDAHEPAVSPKSPVTPSRTSIHRVIRLAYERHGRYLSTYRAVVLYHRLAKRRALDDDETLEGAMDQALARWSFFDALASLVALPSTTTTTMKRKTRRKKRAPRRRETLVAPKAVAWASLVPLFTPDSALTGDLELALRPFRETGGGVGEDIGEVTPGHRNTVLMYAAEAGDVEAVRLLLRLTRGRAVAGRVNKRKLSALDIAIARNHRRITDIILSYDFVHLDMPRLEARRQQLKRKPPKRALSEFYQQPKKVKRSKRIVEYVVRATAMFKTSPPQQPSGPPPPPPPPNAAVR